MTENLPLRPRKNEAVDLLALRQLLRRQRSLPPRVEIELPLPVVDPAALVCVLDCLRVQRLGQIAANALKGGKNLPRWQAEKLMNADIADLCKVPVQPVLEHTDLFDWELAAEALARLAL